MPVGFSAIESAKSPFGTFSPLATRSAVSELCLATDAPGRVSHRDGQLPAMEES